MSDVNWWYVEFNGTCFIACVSAVHTLYELCTVKWQSASPPVTVDLKETQTLNTYYLLRIVICYIKLVQLVKLV